MKNEEVGRGMEGTERTQRTQRTKGVRGGVVLPEGRGVVAELVQDEVVSERLGGRELVRFDLDVELDVERVEVGETITTDEVERV